MNLNLLCDRTVMGAIKMSFMWTSERPTGLKPRWSLASVNMKQLELIMKWKGAVSHQDVLFLRFLSLPGSISFSLLREFILPGWGGEVVSWAPAVVLETSPSCSELWQSSGTGNACRVNVCEWNRGEQANRALTASWSSRLFFCCGGSETHKTLLVTCLCLMVLNSHRYL